MFGVIIEYGIKDWQIIQHKDGYGNLTLGGTYQVPKAAIKEGVKSAKPIIRVMNEDDNSPLIPWTNTHYEPSQDGMSGTWNITLTVEAGGLYRIETGLDTKSTKPNLGWIFRGDVRFHIGIGDVFVIAGQSNSSGYGKDSAMDPISTYVHLYRNRSSWDIASHPINESTYAVDGINTEMGVSGVSPYISFGKVLHKLSHYPVGLISTALGGSPISRWDINQKGDLYHNMIEKIKECGNQVAGILWYQGCSDTSPSMAANYYDSFQRLVLETRKELGYTIPFFTFQLNRQINGTNDSSWGLVKEAQRIAGIRLPGVYTLPTTNCTLSDSIHNNASSSIMLGEKMAKLCAGVLYGKTDFFPPDIEKAILENNILRLTFKHMKRGFVILNSSPSECGFLIEDKSGINPITNIQIDEDQRNELLLSLSRSCVDKAFISFAFEANPTPQPPMDEVTYLPPLSFYHHPIITLE